MDSLRSVFKRLNLILDGEACIFIKDLIWRNIAISIWDTDKDGYVTPIEGQMSQVPKFANEATANQIEILDMRNLVISAIYGGDELSNAREIYMGPTTGGNGNAQFFQLQKLEFIDIGGLTDIRDRFCESCISLKNVLLNDVITNIGSRAFAECITLEEISELPDSLITMNGWGHFNGCSSLKSLIIGRGLTTMTDFEFYNCTSMQSFYIKAVTPPAMGGRCFDNNPCTIYVPRGSGAVYKSATNWSQYASRIQEYDF